jgi:hypothetical protein
MNGPTQKMINLWMIHSPNFFLYFYINGNIGTTSKTAISEELILFFSSFLNKNHLSRIRIMPMPVRP